AVQVDPDALVEGARRLAVAAGTLEEVAGRVAALCSAAGACLASFEVASALEETGRETARVLGQGATAAADLGTRTRLAAQGYRLLEESLTGRWQAAGGTADAADPAPLTGVAR